MQDEASLAEIITMHSMFSRVHILEWDAFHYIRRNVGDIIDEAEGQLNNLKSDYKELELESSGNFEHGRDLVLEASEIAQDALELLDARRLDKQKLRSALEAIAAMFHKNY